MEADLSDYITTAFCIITSQPIFPTPRGPRPGDGVWKSDVMRMVDKVGEEWCRLRGEKKERE